MASETVLEARRAFKYAWSLGDQHMHLGHTMMTSGLIEEQVARFLGRGRSLPPHLYNVAGEGYRDGFAHDFFRLDLTLEEERKERDDHRHCYIRDPRRHPHLACCECVDEQFRDMGQRCPQSRKESP